MNFILKSFKEKATFCRKAIGGLCTANYHFVHLIIFFANSSITILVVSLSYKIQTLYLNLSKKKQPLVERQLQDYSTKNIILTTFKLTLCSPNLTIGTSAHLPSLTFGTDIGVMQNELNPLVLHLWTQWHCLELSVNFHWIPIVSYTGEHPALSLLMIFQLGYVGVLTNNLACNGFSTKWAKSWMTIFFKHYIHVRSYSRQ